MGTLIKSRGIIVLALVLFLASQGIAHAAGVTWVVDSLLAKYKTAGQGWVGACNVHLLDLRRSLCLGRVFRWRSNGRRWASFCRAM
jgi:hypothetical protein